MSSAPCCVSAASLSSDSFGQFAAPVLDFQADLVNSWSVAGTGSVGISVTLQLHFTLDGRGWGVGGCGGPPRQTQAASVFPPLGFTTLYSHRPTWYAAMRKKKKTPGILHKKHN